MKLSENKLPVIYITWIYRRILEKIDHSSDCCHLMSTNYVRSFRLSMVVSPSVALDECSRSKVSVIYFIENTDIGLNSVLIGYMKRTLVCSYTIGVLCKQFDSLHFLHCSSKTTLDWTVSQFNSLSNFISFEMRVFHQKKTLSKSILRNNHIGFYF